MPGIAKSIAEWLPFGLSSEKRDGCAPAIADEVTDLFLQLRSPLLRYLSALNLPAQDGEDVVQEVFLALFRHLRQNKPRHNLRGWIFSTAHNLAMKSRQANGRLSERLAVALTQESLIDPELNPEERLAWGRRQDRLRSVVDALAERDRCCLMLRSEGLRYREIGEVLDMSLGAVALSLSRSLAKLSSVDQR